MPKKEIFSLVKMVNESGCFDLQFRRDIRRERLNSPVYYRWKIQFVITAPKSEIKILEKIKKEVGCGQTATIGGQARFSVQKIDDIVNVVAPFFRKNRLSDNKKKGFEMWSKAAEIIFHNKGLPLSKWRRNDLLSLMETHKIISKYKERPRRSKWMEAAKNMASFSRS